ncbi:MAG: hypothetical protein JNL38_03550 [Myxococcales bacterium]|nr:hypothetical protein [Myxococcales bacterium]
MKERGRLGPLALALAGVASLACEPRPAAAPGPTTRHLSRQDLAVTRGDVTARADGRVDVHEPTVRAVARGGSGAVAALRFTYLGPTAARAPLSSGEVRTQVGLKLLARDGCNVIYAMWRAGPGGGIHVQAKRNPGRSLSLECGAEGYATLRPEAGAPIPPLEVGDHELRARIEGGRLRVEADGVVAWEGSVEPFVRGLRGPAGLRSDNARFVADLAIDER